MVELLFLMLKGVVGLMAIGIVIIALCAIAHVFGYMRKQYPRTLYVIGFAMTTTVVVCLTGFVLALLGLLVDAFIWSR